MLARVGHSRVPLQQEDQRVKKAQIRWEKTESCTRRPA